MVLFIEEKEKEEIGGKNAINSGHYVLPIMPKCIAHTMLGPIIFQDGVFHQVLV